MKYLRISSLVMLWTCMICATCSAGEFDGSKPLLCAVIQAFECEANGSCEPVSVEDVNFTYFIKIDFKKKEVTGTRENGEIVSSKIQNMVVDEGVLILQGVENSKGWCMAINTTTGKMTLNATGDRASFSVFGACIVQ